MNYKTDTIQVIYRMPISGEVVSIRQTSGSPVILDDYAAITEHVGFVIAPFQVTDDSKIIIVRPDVIDHLSLEELRDDDVELPSISEDDKKKRICRRKYEDDFDKFHSRLTDGTFRKLVLARSEDLLFSNPIDSSDDLNRLARKLFYLACRRYEDQFVTLVMTPQTGIWLMATPETLMWSGCEEAHAMALAGTMPKPATMPADWDKSMWSGKNYAEHRLVVDYIKECFKPFAKKIDSEMPQTVTAANVCHLRSWISATLKPNQNIGEIVANLHPTPAVSGLPQAEACRFIAENETCSRRYYGGFVGKIYDWGDVSFNVTLRCMQILPDRYRLYAGGGLMPESSKNEEWEETCHKMQTMKGLLSLNRYSDKENVNILTAQLKAYGVSHIVVCPGSRNAPLTHNFNINSDFICHSVVDERSAGFYAIGLSQATGDAVAVCVTSGSAIMNVSPAIAEAYYQGAKVIVISADRPPQWIGQRDGQTMPQPGILDKIVCHSVSLREPTTDEERWYCRRLVDEAMVKCLWNEGRPVHINIEISEPLYQFTTERLPRGRRMKYVESSGSFDFSDDLRLAIKHARRPMIIVGQSGSNFVSAEKLRKISEKIVVLSEPLSGSHSEQCAFDLLLGRVESVEYYCPDLVIYLGGHIVSKRLKAMLRGAELCRVWIVNEDGAFYDTFCHLDTIIKSGIDTFISRLEEFFATYRRHKDQLDFCNRWYDVLTYEHRRTADYQPAYSETLAVKLFEEHFQKEKGHPIAHYGNSMPIRLASIYANHHVLCNRGINGIEGSVSTACGYSLATKEKVFCVVGDLSFFYDSNALWQNELKGNLRILLLNNGGGGIFHSFEGLSNHQASRNLVAGTHDRTAAGLCKMHSAKYLQAHDENDLRIMMEKLFAYKGSRPVLLEVFTNPSIDNEEYNKFKNI